MGKIVASGSRCRQVVVAFEQVDFVDDQQDRHFLGGDAVEVFLVLFGVLDHVSDVQEYVGVGESAFGELKH